MKILSLILPTYNAENFLDKGLSSMILPQEYMDKLEVIVVNDGSPDQSVVVAQKYVDRYPDTIWILNKENGGHGSGINAGSKAAKGKYFKVVDADDWVDTAALIKTIDLLETTECDALLQSYRTFDISIEDESKAEISYRVKYFEEETHPDHIYSLKEVVEHWDDCFAGMGLHGLCFKTEFYQKLNYDLTEKVFYEDQEYNTIPLSSAKRVCLFDEELYIYRIGDVNQSVSTQSSLNRISHFEKVIKKEIAYEPLLSTCPEGAYEHWVRKLSKFLCDYFRLLYIKSEDKKCYRKAAEEMCSYVSKNSPSLYASVKTRFNIFKFLNRMHMSDETYEKLIVSFLKRRKS